MPRRILEGNVISTKTDKTVTVLVERRFKHPVYKKYIKKTSKFTAHDELNTCQEGDAVQIIECRPLSKTKRWAVLKDGEAVLPPLKKTSSKAAKLGIEKAEPAAKKAKAPAKKDAAAKKEEPAAKAEKKEAKKKAPAKKPAAKKETKAKKDTKK